MPGPTTTGKPSAVNLTTSQEAKGSAPGNATDKPSSTASTTSQKAKRRAPGNATDKPSRTASTTSQKEHHRPSATPSTSKPATVKPSSTAVAHTQAAVQPGDAGCDAECAHDGQTATCRAHIHLVAFQELLGTPDSCDAARNITIARCPACKSCSTESAGCDVLSAPAMPKAETPEEACATNCAVGDQVASCQDRIQWSSQNTFKSKPDACESSLQLVLNQCPRCTGCTVRASGCRVDLLPAAPPAAEAPPDCRAGAEEEWDATKRKFCCESAGRGCVIQDLPHADPSHRVKFRKQFELQPGAGSMRFVPGRLAALSAGSCLCVLLAALATVRLCMTGTSARARGAETYLPMREGMDEAERERQQQMPLREREHADGGR